MSLPAPCCCHERLLAPLVRLSHSHTATRRLRLHLTRVGVPSHGGGPAASGPIARVYLLRENPLGPGRQHTRLDFMAGRLGPVCVECALVRWCGDCVVSVVSVGVNERVSRSRAIVFVGLTSSP